MYENAFYTGVALYGDGIDDDKAQELIDLGFNWERTRMLAGRSQVAGDDGGLITSVAYGFYQYFHVEAYFIAVVESALGLDLRPECTNLPNLAVWLAYLRQPDGRFFKVCDYGSRGYIQDGGQSLYRFMVPIVGLFKEPVARAIWDPPNWTAAEEVIWKDKSVKRRRPKSDWPLGRFFEGPGMVIMRSDWDRHATAALFNCGDAYYGHQNADENSFIIFKEDVLAIDSGDYEGWNWHPHDHDANYSSRTYAHNTITVYDPDEEFRTPGMIERGRDNPNDGGQKLLAPAADSRGDIGPTPPECDRGDVVAFESTSKFVYVCGDASKAYSDHKLKSFTRQFVYFAPDLFVVFDRVVSTKPEYKKRWLLHSVNQPDVTGKSFELEMGGGRLISNTLLPRDARLTSVGGPGKEFWNEHNQYNYKPVKNKPSNYSGAWRMEVTPASARQEDFFLHVLYTQRSAERWRPKPDLVTESSGVGMRLTRANTSWEVLFATKGDPAGHIRIVEGGSAVVDRDLTKEVMPQSYIGIQE
jgi:heparin/heparan-sulfate lyase